MELGVNKIYPVIIDRTIVDTKGKARKNERCKNCLSAAVPAHYACSGGLHFARALVLEGEHHHPYRKKRNNSLGAAGQFKGPAGGCVTGW